jgi:cell wall-associated NlpC family hydrolase
VSVTAERAPSRRWRGRIAAALTAVAAVGVAAFTAQSAGANPPAPHDAIGHLDSVRSVSATTLQFVGWAADPDALTAPGHVSVLIDGFLAHTTLTDVARPDIAKADHTGPTSGFSITMPSPAPGHTVCIAAGNAGSGLDTVLGCTPTPYGTRLTAAQMGAHNPMGGVNRVWGPYSTGPTWIAVLGWAVDEDYRNRPTTVVVYVDGVPRATLNTSRPRTDIQQKYRTGPNTGYLTSLTVSAGSHLVCVWLVNVGLGGNVSQGCYAVDTRGPAGSTAFTAPAANARVLAEARKHLGQKYVWGAAGPTTFDCSGLVEYSYLHAAAMSLPRVAADQFAAAHLIPASRAVPGDLVFYHDGVGSVYHVGIYTGPGQTIAAIDEQEGIAAQPIWDPASATYGSFTHN